MPNEFVARNGIIAQNNSTVSGSLTVTQGINSLGNVGIGTASPTTPLQISKSVTASGSIARGALINNTLTAAANSDVLVGLDINTTFNNSGFSGISQIYIRELPSSGFNTPNNILAKTEIQGATSDWNSSNGGILQLRTIGSLAKGVRIGRTSGVAWIQGVEDNVTNNIPFAINAGGGNVLIGTATDAGYKLEVNGRTKVSGSNILSTNATTSAALLVAGPNAGVLAFSSYSNGGGEIQAYQNGGVSVGGTLLMNRQGGTILIGTGTDVPSSALTVESITKGFLPPRMTLVNKTSISTPATGLEVFDTDNNRPSYKDSVGWKNVANTDDITLVQNGNQLFLTMNFI